MGCDSKTKAAHQDVPPDGNESSFGGAFLMCRLSSTHFQKIFFSRSIVGQELAGSLGVGGDALPPRFGVLGADYNRPASRVNIANLQRTQLLTPQCGVVSERKHHSIAQRFGFGRLNDLKPLFLVRNPGQFGVPPDQTASAVTGKSFARRVFPTPDRICFSNPLFYKIVVIETNGRQSLL